jgi:2,3-bisphosphoglycerate-independent phosphoglycerate mutase
MKQTEQEKTKMEQVLKGINKDLFKEFGFKEKHKHKWVFVVNGKDKQGYYKEYKCKCGSKAKRY